MCYGVHELWNILNALMSTNVVLSESEFFSGSRRARVNVVRVLLLELSDSVYEYNCLLVLLKIMAFENVKICQVISLKTNISQWKSICHQIRRIFVALLQWPFVPDAFMLDCIYTQSVFYNTFIFYSKINSILA